MGPWRMLSTLQTSFTPQSLICFHTPLLSCKPLRVLRALKPTSHWTWATWGVSLPWLPGLREEVQHLLIHNSVLDVQQQCSIAYSMLVGSSTGANAICIAFIWDSTHYGCQWHPLATLLVNLNSLWSTLCPDWWSSRHCCEVSLMNAMLDMWLLESLNLFLSTLNACRSCHA